MKRTMFLLGIIGALILLLGAGARETPAGAPAKPQFTLKLMGINRTLDTYKLYEEWGRTIEERTKGRVKFEWTSLPELGLGGAETIRLIKTGGVDIAEVFGGYIAGELPLQEILDLPGIFPDTETVKKGTKAWKPTEAKILEGKANAVLLASWTFPPNYFLSKKPIRNLEDFKGLKIRVQSVANAQLVAGLGGEPLSIAFAEVYTALERGTIDVGIAAPKATYGLKWYEVTKYMVGPIPHWPHLAVAINKDVWNKLSKDIQRIMKEEAERIIEGKGFDSMEMWDKQGIDLNKERGVEYIPLSPDIQAAVQRIVQEKIVPDWVRRAGPDGAKLFNQAIAPTAGFTVAH